MAVFGSLFFLLGSRMVASEVLRIGAWLNTPGSATDAKGKLAIETWASWVNNTANQAGFTVEIEYVEMATSATNYASTIEGWGTSKHAIFPPYTSTHTKSTVDAVNSTSNVPILCWGGASDSIFTTNCAGKKCFGGFTTASHYLAPSLNAVLAKARTADAAATLTVAIIKNDNPFSTGVADAGLAHVTATSGLSMVSGAATVQAVTVARTALTDTDVATVNNVIAATPDIMVLVGHPGDVEQMVIQVQSHATYRPKAIIATNGLISSANYESAGGLGTAAMQNVIMPDQWDDTSTATDSIVGWTSADFSTALGDSATYHSASAGALSVMLTHAMRSGTESNNRVDNLASLLAALNSTQTFYGKMDWQANGMLDASAATGKPMYGKQMQGTNQVVVAPAGSMVYPMPAPTSNTNTTGNEAVMANEGMRGASVAGLAAVLSLLVAFAG